MTVALNKFNQSINQSGHLNARVVQGASVSYNAPTYSGRYWEISLQLNIIITDA